MGVSVDVGIMLGEGVGSGVWEGVVVGDDSAVGVPVAVDLNVAVEEPVIGVTERMVPAPDWYWNPALHPTSHRDSNPTNTCTIILIHSGHMGIRWCDSWIAALDENS